MDTESKVVEIRVLPFEFWLYSHPIILMMNFKGGKRAEAAQWTLEIQKMLRGIFESVKALEVHLNRTLSNKRMYVEDQEIILTQEQKYWAATYLTDNAILRIYACLDKIAQMSRCYFEDPKNGGILRARSRCGCVENMTENNCTLGGLITSLSAEKENNLRNKKIIKALNILSSNKSIVALRTYRNTFTHRKHKADQSIGLNPDVLSMQDENGMINTNFSFGDQIPSIGWFRTEIVNAHNAMICFLSETGATFFPRDFQLNRDMQV